MLVIVSGSREYESTLEQEAPFLSFPHLCPAVRNYVFSKFLTKMLYACLMVSINVKR
jgi:hypothetical protein